nr:uncharacterized protein CTRU02_03595 [Colletotrichum truncatum]KAF6796617.1 hypothetical protein CTRU02_03595 [Colletotrichum truncatum]
MTGHVPDFIVYLINSPGCIDKQQNRLNARAARKLELVISKMIPVVAECSPEGNKKLGDWAASICELASASAGMPAFISLMEKIIDLLFRRPYFTNNQMNVFFWVTDRAIWGRIFRSLWRHPRVCKGTMEGVVKLTMQLLDIEKRLFLSENRVGPNPISNEPPFSLHNLNFGGSHARSLVDIVNKLVDSPPRSVTHDLELDDLEPQLRMGDGTPVESNKIIPDRAMATYFLLRNIKCLGDALRRSLPFDLTTPVLDQFPVLNPSIPPSLVSRNDALSKDRVPELEEGTLDQPRPELGAKKKYENLRMRGSEDIASVAWKAER